MVLSVAVSDKLVRAQPIPKPPDTYLSGKIVNFKSGEPVGRAILSLQQQEGAQSYSCSSDQTGNFRFDGVQPGRYALSARKSGFLFHTYGAQSFEFVGPTIHVAAGEKKEGLLFRLMPEAVISGRVTDDEEEPVPKAVVELLRSTYPGGPRLQVPGGRVMADERGEYRIPELAPGRYFLIANTSSALGSLLRGEAAASANPAASPGLAPTFFPGSIDLAGASPIDLAGGAELTHVDIRLRRSRLFHVQGRLVGGELSGDRKYVLVLFRNAQDESLCSSLRYVVTSGTDGAFRFDGIPPGSYLLANMPSRDAVSGQLPVQVSTEDIDGLSLFLSPPAQIVIDIAPAREQDNLGNVRGAKKGSRGKQGGGPIELTLTPSLPVAQVRAITGQVELPFTLDRFAPGNYSLHLKHLPKGSYIKAIRMDGTILSEPGIEISSGPHQLNLEVAQDGGSVSGIVKGDNLPEEGSLVVLSPTKPSPINPIPFAITDADGAFKVDGVAPGEYDLFALSGIEYSVAIDSGFRKLLSRKAHRVNIDPKSNTANDLTLLTRETIYRELY